MSSAILEARNVCELYDSEHRRVLDIGCGVGRLVLGLLWSRSSFQRYVGIDVDKDRIGWCEQNLAPKDPRVEFFHFDLANQRYNPNGAMSIREIDIPNASFECIYLYSVITHMYETDAIAYLEKISDWLTDDGVAYITVFVDDSAKQCEVNPEWYGPLDWRGPLHCVLYNKKYFEELLAAMGYRFGSSINGINVDGQTAYVVRKT